MGNNKEVEIGLPQSFVVPNSHNDIKNPPILDTIVTLDPRAVVLHRVEDSMLQWMQVAGIFIATSFVIIGLVDNRKKRKKYSLFFFAISFVILVLVFFQYFKFRNELKNLNIEEPLRIDILLFIVVVSAIVVGGIAIDHFYSDITK